MASRCSPAPKVGTCRFRTVMRARLLQRRSEEHTSELQSQFHLVCRLLLEKKKKKYKNRRSPKLAEREPAMTEKAQPWLQTDTPPEARGQSSLITNIDSDYGEITTNMSSAT